MVSRWVLSHNHYSSVSEGFMCHYPVWSKQGRTKPFGRSLEVLVSFRYGRYKFWYIKKYQSGIAKVQFHPNIARFITPIFCLFTKVNLEILTSKVKGS